MGAEGEGGRLPGKSCWRKAGALVQLVNENRKSVLSDRYGFARRDGKISERPRARRNAV